MPTQMPRVYATLDPEQMRALKAMAERRDRKISWQVRQAELRLIEAEKDPQFDLFIDFPKRKSINTNKEIANAKKC